MKILVIDGQGGRLGCALIEAIRRSFPTAEITAVGVNSTASAAMMRTRCADQVATGENAVIVCCRQAEIIACPLGVALADSMLGEVSAAMANAVASSAAHRVLIPINLCRTYVAGVEGTSSSIIDSAMAQIRALVKEREA